MSPINPAPKACNQTKQKSQARAGHDVRETKEVSDRENLSYSANLGCTHTTTTHCSVCGHHLHDGNATAVKTSSKHTALAASASKVAMPKDMNQGPNQSALGRPLCQRCLSCDKIQQDQECWETYNGTLQAPTYVLHGLRRPVQDCSHSEPLRLHPCNSTDAPVVEQMQRAALQQWSPQAFVHTGPLSRLFISIGKPEAMSIPFWMCIPAGYSTNQYKHSSSQNIGKQSSWGNIQYVFVQRHLAFCLASANINNFSRPSPIIANMKGLAGGALSQP